MALQAALSPPMADALADHSDSNTAPTPRIGRPSTYTPEIADRICEQLADGISLRSVCLADDMPAKSTVFKWLRTYQSFADQYARAKEESADALADEMTDIADDGSNDWMERHDKEGKSIGWAENGEAINRSRLRVDTRKWIASKLKPKKYGDRVEHNHTHSLAEMLGAVPVVTDPLLAGQSSVATLPAKPEPLVIDAESTPITSPDDNS